MIQQRGIICATRHQTAIHLSLLTTSIISTYTDGSHLHMRSDGCYKGKNEVSEDGRATIERAGDRLGICRQ